MVHHHVGIELPECDPTRRVEAIVQIWFAGGITAQRAHAECWAGLLTKEGDFYRIAVFGGAARLHRAADVSDAPADVALHGDGQGKKKDGADRSDRQSFERTK